MRAGAPAWIAVSVAIKSAWSTGLNASSHSLIRTGAARAGASTYTTSQFAVPEYELINAPHTLHLEGQAGLAQKTS